MTVINEMRERRNLVDADERLESNDLIACFKQTFDLIGEMKELKGLISPSLYNLVLTDGHRLIATRYSTKPEEESRSLHIASNAECYLCEKGFLRMREATKENQAVLISSEVMSDERGYWQEVPENHCILVDENLKVQVHSMN